MRYRPCDLPDRKGFEPGWRTRDTLDARAVFAHWHRLNRRLVKTVAGLKGMAATDPGCWLLSRREASYRNALEARR